MSLNDWLLMHLSDFSELPLPIQGIALAILFVLIFDFYHLLFSAVLTWFKK